MTTKAARRAKAGRRTRVTKGGPPGRERRSTAREGGSPTRRSRRPRRARRWGAKGLPWGALAAVGALAVVGLLAYAGRSQGGGASAGDPAPGFTLPSTQGGSVALSDLRGRAVLLYFSEGVGCDPCFYQMVELERNADLLDDVGLTVLPIVVNPATDVRRELTRFGIRTPFLIDADRSVSAAYGVLGQGMHADLPGHTFVLVDEDGRIRREVTYPSMFVETEALLDDLGLAR